MKGKAFWNKLLIGVSNANNMPFKGFKIVGSLVANGPKWEQATFSARAWSLELNSFKNSIRNIQRVKGSFVFSHQGKNK